jgi:sugar fermentation stimulation protein A
MALPENLAASLNASAASFSIRRLHWLMTQNTTLPPMPAQDSKQSPNQTTLPALAPTPAWQEATLIRRYKRFLADVRLANGSELTLHCPNTGSMKNCVLPETSCWYSTSDNPKRKYPNTLEVVTTPGGHLAGVNTGSANHLVEVAIKESVIAELRGYRNLRREVVYGEERSRCDFLLSDSVSDVRQCYVEVKSVTLMDAEGQGLFPDAVSERGSKHLRELIAMVAQGHRAVLLFCVQHTGIEWVEPADAIDPVYGKTLREALVAGVEVLAYQARLDPVHAEIVLVRALPIKI